MATIEMKLKTPTVPNYMLRDDRPAGRRQDGLQLDASWMIDIADLSDTVLSEIAAEWREALMANARKRRMDRAAGICSAPAKAGEK